MPALDSQTTANFAKACDAMFAAGAKNIDLIKIMRERADVARGARRAAKPVKPAASPQTTSAKPAAPKAA